MNYFLDKESQTLEFKTAEKSLPLSLYETYSSFANTKGGTIVLGIKEGDKGNQILGVHHVASLKKDFFNAISNKNKVSACLGTDELWHEELVDGKTLVCITVPEAPRFLKPVYLNGNPALTYVRRNDGDYLASDYERKAMELDSFPQKQDMKTNSMNLKLEDLNQETIRTYRRMFDETNPGNLFSGLEDVLFFKSIGALRLENNQYLATNAAVLLFGNYLQIKQLYPEYNLDYREDVSHSTRWDFRLDASDLSWSGNIFDFLMMTISHMKPSLPSPFHLADDGITEDGKKLMVESVREGIVNAVSNCDFLLPGGVVILYEGDKIVFKNAGRLRLPLNRALVGGDSDPRNEGVMNLLHLVRIGDKAGTGIPNIVLKLKKLGYPSPIWEDEAFPSKTTLTFLFPRLEFLKTADELDKKIISLLAKNGQSDATSLAKTLGVSTSTMSLALKKLKNGNVVDDNGKPTKGKKFFLKR